MFRMKYRDFQKHIFFVVFLILIYTPTITLWNLGLCSTETDLLKIDGLSVPCGAVAVHAIAEASGKHIPLAEIIDILGGPKRLKHSLNELNKSLRELGIESEVINVSFNALYRELKKDTYFFILAVKGPDSETNHCVAVLDDKNGKLIVFDFFDYAHQWSKKRTQKAMLGPAIAVPRNPASTVLHQDQNKSFSLFELTTKQWVFTAIGALTLLCALLVLRCFVRDKLLKGN